MRMLKALSCLLSALFLSSLLIISGSAKEGVKTLDEAVLKLERDISLNANERALLKDLKLIEKISEELPVKRVPEVDYLLNRKNGFERGKVGYYEQLLKGTHLSISILMPIIALISIYSIVLFSHSLRLRESIRNGISFVLLVLLLCAFIFKGYFFVVATSFAVGFTVFVRRKKLAIFFVVLVSGLILLQSAERSLSSFLSQENLLYLKLERDGFAPEFLIGTEKDKLYRDFELITNKQALGYLNLRGKLSNLIRRSADAKFKAAVYNNIGFEFYRIKKFDEALEYFKKSKAILDDPKVLYNIYLTYASKLDFKSADRVLKQMKHQLPDKIKPVPLLIHVSDLQKPEFKFSFLWQYELVFVLLSALSALLLSRVKPVLPRMSGIYFFIPGLRNFEEEYYFSLSFLILIFVAISIFVEVMLCL